MSDFVDGEVLFGYNHLYTRRVVRVVEGAALEMLCGETHLGFESLTLRQSPAEAQGFFVNVPCGTFENNVRSVPRGTLA